MDKEQLKRKTLHWLNWHLDEMMENELAMNIPDEDKVKNSVIEKEISECIKWVKSIKVNKSKPKQP